MAELLVFQRDNTHSDPTVEKRECFKKGDVVAIADDGHPWSSRECSYPFKIETVVGAKVQYEYLAATDKQLAIPKSALRVPAMRGHVLKNTAPKPVRRRRYQYTTEIVRKAHA